MQWDIRWVNYNWGRKQSGTNKNLETSQNWEKEIREIKLGELKTEKY